MDCDRGRFSQTRDYRISAMIAPVEQGQTLLFAADGVAEIGAAGR
jgi:hypothetical protein